MTKGLQLRVLTATRELSVQLFGTLILLDLAIVQSSTLFEESMCGFAREQPEICACLNVALSRAGLTEARPWGMKR